MEKDTLRKEALERRDQIPEKERQKKSQLIIGKLEKLPEFIQASHILAYYSYGSEVETVSALEGWCSDKKLYLPKLKEDSTFIALPFSELIPNRYNIPEPVEGKEAESLDIILVPGVAFDRNGGRLGMGKGYYDRFLSKQKGVLKIGLAFVEQILASLPLKPYDENVDLIITDKEIIRSAS